MDFFIKESNIRPGNRGGRDLFKWDDVRMMNNKERESYLGATQSIGFLDKGGKWRKRDWWLNYQPENALSEAEKIRLEREAIKAEEKRLFNDSLYGKEKQKYVKTAKDVKLTDYEWKELMKKEANFNPEDSRLNEFYENDEHKPGLGIKSSISFRTNPYEKQTQNNLSRLDGINIEDNAPSDNPYIPRGNNKNDNQEQSTLINKYIKEYLNNKTNEKEKSKHNRERSRSRKRKNKRKHSRERNRSKERHKRK